MLTLALFDTLQVYSQEGIDPTGFIRLPGDLKL
jgi:hypothetical protein